jgi:hypothetical protein
VLWELDESKIPDDPKEKKAMWVAAMDEIRKTLKNGINKDWGVFLDVSRGFNIVEGEPEEVYALEAAFVPLARMEIHPFISLDQAQKAIKKM